MLLQTRTCRRLYTKSRRQKINRSNYTKVSQRYDCVYFWIGQHESVFSLFLVNEQGCGTASTLVKVMRIYKSYTKTRLIGF
mmetsp:Transcript_3148/g.6455  ORF Transcript_3148/g.6455 Transcript_3148/m.6455 type:complete len:81 (-) Transcript_3148:115-357(-)